MKIAWIVFLWVMVACGEGLMAGDNIWTSNGPCGGIILSLAIDPADPSTLYAGTEDGGVFKSNDNGATWVQSGLNHGTISALAIDPANPSLIYAGTDGWGVYKSTNGGGSWTSANLGLTNPHVSCLTIDPTSPSVIYAGTKCYDSSDNQLMSGGVFKSTDGGDSWTAANSGIAEYPNVNTLAIDPANPSLIYAGTDDWGVYKSTNGGGTWTPANSGLPPSRINALVIDPTNPSIVYAGRGCTGCNNTGIYKSTNSGESWVSVGNSQTMGIAFVYRLAIDPVNPSTLYVGTIHAGVLKSTDSGENWTQVSTGLTNTYGSILSVNALAIDPANPLTLYAGTDFGVFKSAGGGGVWAAANSGLTATNIHSLAVNPGSSSELYAGFSDGVHKSSDGAQTWAASGTGLVAGPAMDLAINPVTPSTLYAGMFNATGVCKSTDSGSTWVHADGGMLWTVKVLAIDPVTPSTLYASNDWYLYMTTNSGGDWSNRTGFSAELCDLAVNPAVSSTLYAATWGRGVQKSTDRGEYWTPVNTGLDGDYSLYVYTLALDPTDPSTLYAGTYQGVYKSTNGGAAWTLASSGLSGLALHVFDLAITPTMLLAGTNNGVYKSMDGGGHWTAMNEGLSNRIVNRLAISPSDPSTLYAGTRGGGVFSFTFSLQGDANSDGVVNQADYDILATYLSGSRTNIPAGLSVCDMNGDQRVDTLDLVLLKRAVGK